MTLYSSRWDNFCQRCGTGKQPDTEYCTGCSQAIEDALAKNVRKKSIEDQAGGK